MIIIFMVKKLLEVRFLSQTRVRTRKNECFCGQDFVFEACLFCQISFIPYRTMLRSCSASTLPHFHIKSTF